MNFDTNYFKCEITSCLRIPRINLRSRRRNSAENATDQCAKHDLEPNNREMAGFQDPPAPSTLSLAGKCVHTSMPSVIDSQDHPGDHPDTDQEQYNLPDLAIQNHTLGSNSLPCLSSDIDEREMVVSKKLTPPAVIISDFSFHTEGGQRHTFNGRRHSINSNGCIEDVDRFFYPDNDIDYSQYKDSNSLIAQRNMSYLSISTVSSIGGEDRSRRGSLVDLEAEGLVMTGDGRLQRTKSSPGRLIQHLIEVDGINLEPETATSRLQDSHDSKHLAEGQGNGSSDLDSMSHHGCHSNCKNHQENHFSDLCSSCRQCVRNGVCSDPLGEISLPKQASQWRKVKGVVQWSPFVQTYKRQKYPWIQLAGHQGSFRPGGDGTILKKLCGRERLCLEEIKLDCLSSHVPHLISTEKDEDGKEYLRMQDLLSEFVDPCVMDCKMGLRTYMEEELAKAREKPKLRKDMYEKMISVNPHAPTEEEHRLRAVTKPRYMVWRETISSTATLGFRIEALRRSDGFSSKDYKTTCTEQQVTSEIRSFVSGYNKLALKYMERLKQIRADLKRSEFFKTHELVGSSLLFVHDKTGRAGVWMIDFAKTTPLPPNIQITHDSVWQPGNHEDGYLIGIDNLIAVFDRLVASSI